MYLSAALVLATLLSSLVGAVPLFGTNHGVRVAISKRSGLCDSNGIVKKTELLGQIRGAVEYVSRCRS